MFKFKDLDVAKAFLESKGFKVRIFTNYTYYVYPSVFAKDYPKIGCSGAHLHLAVLLNDGKFHLCNKDNKALSVYHNSLESCIYQA